MHWVFVSNSRHRVFDAHEIDVPRGIFAEVCADVRATRVEMDGDGDHVYLLVQSNAEILGLGKELGTVQPGKRANLLLLRSDPTQSVDAYGSIAKIILHGKVLDPADLTATNSVGVGR